MHFSSFPLVVRHGLTKSGPAPLTLAISVAVFPSVIRNLVLLCNPKMPELASTTGLDSVQIEEITFDSTTSPVGVDHDAKQIVNFATEDGKEQLDCSVSSPSPTPLDKWNEPSGNMYRYFATIYSFIVMGMNDAASGVSVPWVRAFLDVLISVVGTNSICE